ncbi:MAG: deoxyribodipyrimidine photo-lyase [Actinomycetota bacterium]|nr:deoxyribodipyrimidine photo-lyase [Actinomycetota bacterium]
MTRAIVWFRRDLSLDDNLAWATATRDHTEVLPVYVFDYRLLDRAGPHRRRQLIASVAALADELRTLGGSLTVATGDSIESVTRLAHEHRVDTVVWNNDVTRLAQARDDAVHRRLSHSGISVERSWSTLIHPPGTILTAAGGVPRVFSRFHERWSAARLTEPARAGHARILAIKGGSPPSIDGTAPIAPGSEAAFHRLDAFLERIDAYDVERDLPDRDATSHLSADLRFGTISPRAVVRAVAGSTPGREAFVRQLAWRDWYAHLFAEHPDLVDHAQQPQYDTIAWRSNPAEVQAWKHGRTGYPIVDAGMRELAATGWMPNRLRLISASFLVKDLLADWRIGERHFRHLLIDGDIPQNAGNWQWVAGTGPDAAPYFRVLNPLTQARRFDPNGDYVRRFVPEIAALHGGSIHAPSELGPLELARAGVILGETYPHPIVDHATARERAIATYRAAKKT